MKYRRFGIPSTRSIFLGSLAASTFILLLIVSLLFAYPNASDNYGVIKPARQTAVALTDILGSALLKLEEHFLFYIPLGIIGIWRWMTWGLKRVCAAYYRPIEYSSSSTNSPGSSDHSLSIVTPVYNENPTTFKRALQSWEANKPDEIIAVIDQSDIDCIDVFKEFSKNKTWASLLVTSKPGKRQAIADGVREAKSEIVALVDSDTVWGNDIRDRLLSPFNDSSIAGVTPRNHPLERNSVWQKMTDIFWDIRNFYDLPSQAAMGQVLTCLTGRTSLYRRTIILPKLEEFMNEILFGKKKESGEDKCFTRLVQKDGWKTYYQSSAVIYSMAASDFKTFVSQRLRWTRNSHNSDLVSLIDGWAWRHPYLAFYMVDRFVSTFTLFLGPIFFGISVYLHQWGIATAILALWMVGRTIKILPHLKRHPADLYLLPLFVGVYFMIALIKLYALVTLREQKWIREHDFESGTRVGQADTLIKNPSNLSKRIKNYILTTEIIVSMILFANLALR